MFTNCISIVSIFVALFSMQSIVSAGDKHCCLKAGTGLEATHSIMNITGLGEYTFSFYMLSVLDRIEHLVQPHFLVNVTPLFAILQKILMHSLSACFPPKPSSSSDCKSSVSSLTGVLSSQISNESKNENRCVIFNTGKPFFVSFQLL